MLPDIYGVWMPPQYYQWMRVFSWLQFNVLQLAPADCIGKIFEQIVFRAGLPLLIMLGVLLLAVCWKLGRAMFTHRGRGGISCAILARELRRGLALGTPPCIIIAFCTLPVVSYGLFETFDCERFVEDDISGAAQYYVASVMSLRCSSAGHVNPLYNQARLTTIVLLVIWPVGMPLVIILLMMRTRSALLAKRATFWTRALRFLVREYRPECYWWEAIEMVRRLLLSGFVFLIMPPEMEMMRLLFAQLITLVSLCAVGLIQPYKRSDNNTLAFSAQLLLLFVLLMVMVIKLYKDIEESPLDVEGAGAIMGFSDPFSFSLVVFILSIVMSLLTFSSILMQGRRVIETRRQQMRDAVRGLTRLKYSLNLISLATFTAAGKLTTHEEMRDAGGLTVIDVWEDAITFASEKTIVFFSHQWLGWKEPDPNNVHYPVMVEAINKVLERCGHRPEDVYIWLDYSSIPQKNQSSQLLAIDTIANYAALSKYFIVAAPETFHVDTGLPCDTASYLNRGWCRLEQWAGMAASSQTTHMYVYEKGDLHLLSDRPGWIEKSVNVFTAQFTFHSDKDKLVDVVMALYAYCIACGRYKRAKGAADDASTHGQGTSMWLTALIDRNRKHIFPPEWFGDSIEILENEIQLLLEGKKSLIFSEDAYQRLLRARQALCRLHGADLPETFLAEHGGRVVGKGEASKKASKNTGRSASEKKPYPTPDEQTPVAPAMRDVVFVSDIEEAPEARPPSGGSRRGDRILPNPPTPEKNGLAAKMV